MPPVKDVSRIERESSLLFGLKWSFVGFAIALSFLAGCSSFFDHGPDRYNVVSGPRRPPPMNPGTPGAGQGTSSFHVPQSGYVQQGYPAQGMPAQQPAYSPAMAQGGQGGYAQPGGSPYDMMQPEMESESWWDGWFDWSSDDDEMYQPAPAAYAGYGAPGASPITPPAIAQYQQSYQQPAPATAYQQPMLQPQAMPTYVPPMPTVQQAMPQSRQASPQFAPMLQPQMPHAVAPAPIGQPNIRANVEQQIAELERELAQSERRSQELHAGASSIVKNETLMQPYMRQPQAVSQPKPRPQVMPTTTPVMAGNGGYRVVRLPPPPPRGAQRVQPDPMLRAGIMAPNMTPSSPMPPIVSEPRHNPMQHAPVMQANQPSIDVPLAPGISASSQSSNVPSGLIPPDSMGRPKAGYLGESRYSSRR